MAVVCKPSYQKRMVGCWRCFSLVFLWKYSCSCGPVFQYLKSDPGWDGATEPSLGSTELSGPVGRLWAAHIPTFSHLLMLVAAPGCCAGFNRVLAGLLASLLVFNHWEMLASALKTCLAEIPSPNCSANRSGSVLEDRGNPNPLLFGCSDQLGQSRPHLGKCVVRSSPPLLWSGAQTGVEWSLVYDKAAFRKAVVKFLSWSSSAGSARYLVSLVR